MARLSSTTPSSGGAQADESRRGFAALLLRGGRLTKLAGEVASCAPALGGAAVALLCGLSVPVAGLLSGAFLGLTAEQAAACTKDTGAGENYTCGNSTSKFTKSLSSSTILFLKIEGTTNINVADLAFDLTTTGSAGIRWRSDTSRRVFGATGVIKAVNSGGGNIVINADSELKTDTTEGGGAPRRNGTVVYAKNSDATDGEIRITVASISIPNESNTRATKGHGVYAYNSGAGRTIITATGKIDIGRTHGDGVKFGGAANNNPSTSLNISVASVYAAHRGIRVDHKGRGNVSISATGKIVSRSNTTGTQSENDDGIWVTNDNGASAVSMSLVSVEANAQHAHAIYVKQKSTGLITINATGSIVTKGSGNGHVVWIKRDKWSAASLTFSGEIKSSAGGGDAINIEDPNQNVESAPLYISAATATGRWAGIRVKHKKGGAVTITATGAVSSRGPGDSAISLINDDHASNLKISIESGGSVMAHGNNEGATGISVHQQHGGTVEINAHGTVASSGGHGIYVDQDGNDAVTINVSGTVTGDDDTGNTAIKVAASSNDVVTINLNSGAVVGSANEDAVAETGGNATVSLKSNAEVKGAIKLGAGNDKVILAGGTAGGSIDFEGGSDTLEVTASGAVSIPAVSNFERLMLGTNVDISGALTIGGSGDVSATLAAGTDVAVTTGTAFTLNQTGAGGITFTQAASGQSLAGQTGVIHATNSGAGNISITATGVLSVTNTGGNVHTVKAVNEDAAGGSISVSVNSVDNSASNVRATAILVKNDGSGSTTIRATGHLNAGPAGGDGVTLSGADAAVASSAASLNINVARITTKWVGLRLRHKGGGNVSIVATGTVHSTNTDNNSTDSAIDLVNYTGASAINISVATITAGGGRSYGIKVDQRASGRVSINATGAVSSAGRHGIYVKQEGDGDVVISVAGAVTGDDDDGDSAIKVAAGSGDEVTINLNSGAVVGSANEDAIVETDGDTTLSVNSGAQVNGAINLGAGADTVTVNSGATVGGSVMLGAGADTITVNSGATVGGSVMLGAGDDGVVMAGGTVSGSVDFGAGKDKLTISTGKIDDITATNVELLEFGASAVVDSAITVAGTGTDIGIEVAAGTDVSVSTGSAFTLTQSGGGGIDFTQQGSGSTMSGQTGGISATNAGDGDIEITATRMIELSSAGTGVYAKNSDAAGDDVTINLGTVTVTNGYGVHVVQDGSGSVDIDVSGAIAGAGGNAAIRVEAGSGDDVAVDLSSGAVVGTTSQNAVTETSGNATLTVNSGATVRGTVNLGGGDSDELVVNGTAMLDSLVGVETIKVGATGSAKIEGAFDASTLDVSGGTLSVQDGTIRTHTISGSLTLSGGAISLDVNAIDMTADKFEVTGSFTGNAQNSTTINVALLSRGGAQNIELLRVATSPATDILQMFNVSDPRYVLSSSTDGLGLLLATPNECIESSLGSGEYRCSGTIIYGQALSASDGTRLIVRLEDDARIAVSSGNAFSLTQTGGTGGIAFTQSANGQSVSGTQGGIVASNSGGGAISINVNGSVTGMAGNGIGATNDASGGGITITAGSVYGADSGITAVEGGSGAVNVVATGLVTSSGTGGVGIDARAYATGALIVAAATVTGSAVGIRAVSSGTGAVSVQATGSVAATGATSGIGIDAKTSGGALTITAASVTGSAVGIRAVSSGTGAVSIQATGLVAATGATSGIGIDAKTSGGALTITAASVTGTSTGIKVMATGTGGVSISASGAVTGTGGDGIHVDHDGAGATTITVSSAVTGSTGNSSAAIRTDAQSGSAVTILLNSGASVGTGTSNAIMGGAGNTAVTVNEGATIAGKVKLGDGTDTLTFAGGTFTSVTEFDGGGGSGDTLTFRSGSGSLDATVQTEGLKGWESVVVESGATITGSIRLDDTSKDLTIHGASPSAIDDLYGGDNSSGNTLTLVDFNSNQKTEYSTISGSVNDFETFGIGDGTTISFGTGSHTHDGGLIVASGGTLDVGDDDNDVGSARDWLTVSGNFTGGGRITLDVRFVAGASGNSVDANVDGLTISGSVASGSTTTIHADVDFGGQVLDGSPERIPLVTFTGAGAVDQNAFAFNGSIGRDQDPYGYTLSYDDDSANRQFYLKRLSNTRCKAGTGAGVFICDGAAAIELAQSISTSGTTTLAATLTARTGVDIDGLGTAFTLEQSGGTGGIRFTQSATGQSISATVSGIVANNSGGGAIVIDVNGPIAAGSGDGIRAQNDASGGGITISAGTVTGSSAGIRAVSSGTGAVSIAATGAVTGTGNSGIGIDVSSSGGNVTISAAGVTGTATGIKIDASGTGDVSISATGAVTGTGANGVGIDVSSSGGNVTISAAGVTGTATGIEVDASGAGDVSISATGEVKGTGSDGIFVDLDGSGTTAIAVSSTVTGGTGASVAAIKTNVSSGSDVTVTLNSGASVGTTGSPNAIMDSAGSATVTVNTGASIIGSVTLGAGDDALTFAGGAFSEVTEFDGGAGADTLTFSGGAGELHGAGQSDELKGWESVVVHSGAAITGGIKLAADSGNLTLDGVDISSIGTLTGGAGSANALALESVSGTLEESDLSGWETVRIGDGSTISFGSGSHTLESGLIVAEGGTLNLRNVSGTDEHLEVSGNFAGGGTVALNVSASATMADMLTISGDVSGTTTVDVDGIVMNDVLLAAQAGSARELKLITVHGSVNAGAFKLAAGFGRDDDPYRFRLSFKESEKEFFLRRLSSSECKAGAVTGAFSCEGRTPIELGQSLSASGTTDLVVTLDSQTGVAIDQRESAFVMTQTGGTGGISFTQSANGRHISAPLSGIVADNKAGGAIAISVNGSVSGEGGDGIRALNDASGGGIAILAGSVTGSAAGIVAIGHGSGTVSVSAAGSVAAAAAGGIGISATAGRATAGLSIAAGSVSGGDVGIRAVGSGGAISVSATGAVAGTGTAGVQVDGRVDVTAVAVSVATVTGATGVHVRGDGSGSVSVTATGAVRGTDSAGYGIRVVGGETISSVTVAAAGVESRRTGIRVTASGGADVSVSASGSVEGATHDGIYLDLDGGGETDVRVSGHVMGGGALRTAAIRTVSQTGGSAVRITLASGASVGRKGRRAIMDTRGDATVTVNSGAAVAGEVRLGAGSDSLVFAGGAFSDVTVMDGGSGVDTLRFVRGSGTIDPSVSAAGFRGWESVIVESGAAISGSFTLAADSGDVTFRGADVGSLTALTTKAGSATLSFEGASGSIDGGSVSGWRSISISGGAKIGFGGDSATVSVKEELRVGAGATLEVGGNGSAADTLTISGTFAGGGTATLDVDFANATSDKLVITGDATGRTNVLIGRVGPVPAPASLDDLSPIRNVITVRGTVGAGAAFGGFHELGAFGYQLRPSANGRNFDLIPVLANECESSPGAPGAFTCSGTNTIGVTQTLSASGATSLSVTLNAEARVEAGGAAFVLEQTGGGGSLSLTQSATGMEIGGGTSGIIARNDGGGTISIDVNGSVTAAGGDGIRAAGGSGGSGVAVVAAAVSGSRSGIVAIGSGAGEVAVRASGTVTGTLETGIHARSDGRASVSVGAVSVSGGRTGIHAVAGAAAGGLTITAAAVSGGVTGIHAVASGTGAVSIMASGAVSGGSGDGILLERAAAGRVGISVSGPVGGGSGSGVAAIRTDAAGGSAISIAVNDGGAVGAAGRNAIIGGAGATQVTVNSGGSVAGSVDLGGGADSIVVGAGAGLSGEVTLGDGADEARLSLDANVSGLTRLDGGAGDGDTLRIVGGSGSLPEGGIGTGGLEGWESVVVESGASLSGRIRLAADSRNLTFDGARTRDVDFLTAGGASSVLAFNGVSDSLDANLEGWETVEIGGDSRVRFDAAQLRATAAKTLSVKGTLAFGDSRPGDAFTVDGDFAGGGSVAIDVNFAAGAGVGPTADRLVIGGDATGTTALAISDATPAGAAVAGGDMDIVTVRGEADASSFTLDSDPVAYGAYIYDLKYVAGTAGRDSRFVLSPGDRVSDAGAVLKSAPDAIAAGLARAAGLAARTAARMPAAAVGAGLGMPATSRERGAALAGQRAVDMASASARSLWARFVADSLKTDATGTDGESEVSGSRFQIGADLLSGESAGGMWVAGLTVQYGSVSSEAKGSGGTGRHEASGSGVGAAWTWFGTGGLYVDAQAQFGSFEADYTADTVGVIKKGVGGGTSLAAVEVGRRFAAGDGMMVVPSGRLGRSSVATDKFTSEDGIEIDLGTASTTEVRLGIAAEFAFESGGARLSGSVSRSLGDPDGVVIAGQTVERDVPDGWMELGFGGSYDIDEGKALFLDGAWRASLGDGAESAGTSLSGGFRINW